MNVFFPLRILAMPILTQKSLIIWAKFKITENNSSLNFKHCLIFFFTCLSSLFPLNYLYLLLFCSSFIFLTLFIMGLCNFVLNGTQHSKSVRSIQTHYFWESMTFKTSMWIIASAENKYCRNLMARCHIRLCVDPFQAFSKLFTCVVNSPTIIYVKEFILILAKSLVFFSL